MRPATKTPRQHRPQTPADLTIGGYDAYIFDWDGTLADTMDANYTCMRDALAEHDVPLARSWFDAHAGLSSVEMAALASGQHSPSVDATPAEIAHQRDRNYMRIIDTIRPIPVVVSALEEVRTWAPVALATGGRAVTTLATVDALGLRHNFHTIVTREDVSEGKPSPELFLLAAQKLRVHPSRCLVYEDSIQGFAAAGRAGMDAVDVTPLL